MSSRANASARARRAGETSQPQQVRPQQSQQQQQQLQQQRTQLTKLSIPDAIGLTTLRLGKLENHFSVLEQIVQNLSNSGVGVEGSESFNENVRVVDEAVFQSIVTRLENLEKRQLQPHQQQQPQPQQKINPQVNADVDVIKQDLNIMKKEMTNLKDLLLSLQSFTMQTNQKLADIVFQENIFVDNEIVTNQNLEFDITPNNDENEFADHDESGVSQNIISDS
jgi:hypothetical protein